MATLTRTLLQISFFIIFIANSIAHAESLFQRQLPDGRLVFDAILEQGIPRPALDLIFRMYDYNEGLIPNTTHTVLVDYSLPSTSKRLFLINLETALVESFYVAHGIRSGVVESRSFSNMTDSWKSSLGFFFAKGTYNSQKNGLSLYLEGIDRSNDNAKNRAIVLHGAKYVSEEFIRNNGRLGWSEGCFAVGLEHVNTLVNLLQNGSILFSYHKDLIGLSRRYPSDQSLYGQEILPPGVNTRRTPGEGGGFVGNGVQEPF
ncbi:murein L,D-transpeptidase catalytic domain family protein [Bdellovibrio sp. 22V]|uniref:murein L,D-transpeptidase catalytic domain family protein n=1 Tax=Bdellovibrio TaxID=958 RepID=UPI00254326B3|nr:murein L,D-transpeptidase catalytic domain family protein [Bdellovibrio sp. 22V]WII72925.1 murein L,D-transpeptidase catalytic domain family protein [Bdellovibrio sp. 22V]